MESFLNRYRNITVLLLVIFAQLALLAVQVKNDQDVRVIRVWTVTAVTPVARILEAVRGGAAGVIRNYVALHDAGAENRRLQTELDRLKLENIFLKNDLNTAERAKALQVFQARTPSKTVAASVIGVSPTANSKMIFVDRGSVSGVRRGMAVVTPEGIVGKVIAAYPTASEVLLVTDPDFAAGVISLKTQIRGTLKGQGAPLCKVDYIHAEDKLQPGEWFYTSGDDRIFPRGFPVGVVKSAKPSQPFQDVYLEPSGLGRGLEDVLILIDAVHQELPENPPENQSVYIAPPLAKPPEAAGSTPDGAAPPPAGPGTEADKVRSDYESTAQAQGHTFGEGGVRTKGPDFTKLGQQPAAAPTPGAAGTTPQPTNGQPQQAQPRPAQPSAAPAGAPKAQQPAVRAPQTATPAVRTPQTATPSAGQTAAPKQQPAARPQQNAAPGVAPGTAAGTPTRTQPATSPNGSAPAARQASPAAGNPRPPAASTPGASPAQ